jgi:hypothetical protein
MRDDSQAVVRDFLPEIAAVADVARQRIDPHCLHHRQRIGHVASPSHSNPGCSAGSSKSIDRIAVFCNRWRSGICV